MPALFPLEGSYLPEDSKFEGRHLPKYNFETTSFLIENTEFFDINPHKNSIEYLKERNNLLMLLYDFVIYQYTHIGDTKETCEWAEDLYSSEAIETALRCMSAFKKEQGNFLHYFSSAIKREINRAKAKELMAQKNGGMHVSGKDKEIIRKIYQWLQNHPDIDEEEMYQNAEKWAEDFRLSPDEFRAALLLYQNQFVKSGHDLIPGTENMTVFDTVVGQKNIESGYEQMEAVKDILYETDKAFGQVRKGSRDLLSKWLTNSIAHQDLDFATMAEVAGMSWFDRSLFEMIVKRGVPFKDKDIAQMCQKSSANMTQIVRRFRQSLDITA